MPSEYDVRQARSEGRAEGVRAELQRLRAFTGIDGLAAPDHSLPEHEAYPMYEQSLLERMEREQQRGGWRQEGLPEAEGRAAGATGWIVKPFNPEKLIQVVQKVMG